MRYHLFDRVRICETTGMQDGYLRIDVVNRENNFPIEGAEVSVSYGNSGQTQEAPLPQSPPSARINWF